MSPQEVQILQNFLDQLVQVRGVTQDPQAAALINAATARQPDAAYLLVQRALLMEQAMNAANSQIAGLQAELAEQKALNSTGGRGAQFFDASSNAWGNSASNRSSPLATQAPVQSQAPMATSVTGAPLTVYPQNSGYVPPAVAPLAGTPASSSFFGGSTGSMLGSVAATAAGVAAGAFLYQGISHLLSPASHASFTSGNMLTPDTGSASQLTTSSDNLQSGYFDSPVSDSSSFTDVPDNQSYGDDDSDLI